MVGVVSNFAGSAASWADGLGSEASFKVPKALYITSVGIVFVADSDNRRIRMISNSGFENLKLFPAWT